jgi:uncharacterized membrane protein
MFFFLLDLYTAGIIRNAYVHSVELRMLIVGSYDIFSVLMTLAIFEILTSVIDNTNPLEHNVVSFGVYFLKFRRILTY